MFAKLFQREDQQFAKNGLLSCSQREHQHFANKERLLIYPEREEGICENRLLICSIGRIGS